MVIEIAPGRRPARRRSARSRRVSGWPAILAVALLAAIAALGLSPDNALDDLLDAAMPNGGAIVTAGGISVTDGDTFRIGEERIRVENIDTPELGDGAECLAERWLADLARQNAAALLSGGGEVRIDRTGQDQYGRTLARVSVDGRDFGRAMVGGGYAAEWTGRRVDWCA